MKSTRLLLALMALGAFSVVSVGQDAEAPEAAEEAAPEPPPPPPPPETRPLDEIFIPSEEIAADEELTFPVDILK
ncbi:MAG TPA: hypothetical protein VIV14_02190 [Gammaproteobacteria bacterium]